MSALDEITAIAAHAQSDETAIYCGVTYGQVRAAMSRVTVLEDALIQIGMAASLDDAHTIAAGALST